MDRNRKLANELHTADRHDIQALIEAAQHGDQAACAAVYRLFVEPTYRLAYGLLLNEQDAEEVVQDSFTYAFRSLPSFDPSRSAFRTWLYTITVSRCRNKRRRKWLHTVSLGDVADRLPGRDPLPERLLEVKGMRETIWRALAKLSPKLREAVILRYFEGLTYREMAEVLDIPQKTAESRVRLAHEALHGLLAHQFDGLVEGAASFE